MDITKLSRTELDEIFGDFLEGILILAADFNILYFNRSYGNFTGLDLDRAKGKPLLEFRPGAKAPGVLLTQKPIHGELRKEKEEEYFVNIYPLYEKGRLTGAISVVTYLRDAKFLRDRVQELERKQRILDDLMRERNGTRYTFADILAESESSRDAVWKARKAAASDISILLEGESGTGKEVFAQAIHNESPRSSSPFVVINCGALSSSLLESELFGYEEGSFTGGKKGGKAGLFEAANNGTIFLDEISEMEFPLQVKLLRVLQEQSVRRLGSVKEIPINARVICACNVDLLRHVLDGKFRKDLYYRIAVLHFHIPALRERKQDIIPLVELYIRRYEQKYHTKVTMTERARDCFVAYEWPGNIRELKNAVEYALFMLTDNTIDLNALPSSLQGLTGAGQTVIEPLGPRMRRMEREFIQKVLDRFGRTVDGKKKAAAALGISLATLYNKLGEK